MIYAQFFQLSTGYVPHSIPPRFDPALRVPIPACGTFAFIRLDGRLREETLLKQAEDACRRGKYIGFQLLKGPKPSMATPITPYKAVV